jgi:hypothetical protein
VTKWVVVGGVVVVFAGLGVLDWLDGPASSPDGPLVYALLVLAGAALGWRPPWGGRDGG